ncbi:hypothetical protein OAT67_09435 [Bacteriovoracaceae bacterium]|nr:hypothetical protein [Bacteriovoracaceae bacterium]|tara:strand:+ start:15347 stop:15694 length:348 start_codon:yes stop_codon:yes gene_type:complete
MKLFFKIHLMELIKMILIFDLPLLLFFLFSPYPLPNIHFVFLIVLIVSQYVFKSEKKYKNLHYKSAEMQLKRELKRIPSINEVNIRLMKMFQFHGASIIFTGLLIIIITIFFGQF